MGYETIAFERDGSVATITLNRVDAMNSLTFDLAREVGEAIGICERDEEIRAVILTGNGRAFCAGADLRVFEGLAPEQAPTTLYGLARAMHEFFVVPVRRMGKPVICAVNGVAAGGGLGLALACDLRIAAADARFTLAYSNIAVSPDCSTTFMLPRLVGVSKALELYFFNEVLNADQALSLGLVNRVVPKEELMSVTQDMAKRLAGGATYAYAQTKRLLNRSLSNDLFGQLEDEARAIGLCVGTEDHREGVAAFRAKRPAQFTGR